MRTVLIVLFALALGAGCASTDRKALLTAGYDPQYVDGYIDGYSTGCHTLGHPLYRSVQDTSRYGRDHQYQKGWQDGYSIARTDYAAVW
jgi:hypothetical protein